MRGAINLLGKTVKIDEIIYTITNINFIPEDRLYNSRFYIELESEDGFLNMSIKDLTPLINKQIKSNGSYRKEHIDS